MYRLSRLISSRFLSDCSIQFHVFEVVRQLPRFSMFAFDASGGSGPEPSGYVTLQLQERVQRVAIWLALNTVMPEGFSVPPGQPLLVRFAVARPASNEGGLASSTPTSPPPPPPPPTQSLDGSGGRGGGIGVYQHVPYTAPVRSVPLVLRMEPNGQFTVRTDDVELAGSLIQSLCQYLNVVDLNSTAEFPEFFERIRQLLSRVRMTISHYDYGMCILVLLALYFLSTSSTLSYSLLLHGTVPYTEE